MPRFCANVSLLYPELDFLDRFAAAAADGFRAVECQFPYEFPALEIKKRLDADGLELVLLNAPPGGGNPRDAAQAWGRGDRGVACHADRKAEFDFGIQLALEYAEVLQCPQVHVLSGCRRTGDDLTVLQATLVENLKCAAELGPEIQWFIEPLNTRDVPAYFLTHQDQAHRIVSEIAASNIKVQMDLYHCQIMEGDVAMKLRQYLPTGRVGHLQVAGVPDRHEPDTGELNYSYLLELVDALQFRGWVGCEYRPRLGDVAGGTSAGLGWIGAARTLV